MEEKRPQLGITLGDPAGIGPEIIAKALANPALTQMARCLVVGSRQVMKATGTALKLHIVDDPKDGFYREGIIDLLEVPLPLGEISTGAVGAAGGKAAFAYIEQAIALAMARKVAAVVTGPINKESLHAAAIPYIGHTEIFGALTASPRPLTMFEVENLRVFFLSRHVSLRQSCDLVTKENLIATAKESLAALERMGIAGPLAIAGLNPHCGEDGLFGDEEGREIVPAVRILQGEGMPVIGPVSADSVFHQARQGRFAAVLSLYHDQGHIATKTLDFERTISLTHGLPFLRVSVDHGTAFDIAGKNLASSIGMEEAIIKAACYAPFFQRG